MSQTTGRPFEACTRPQEPPSAQRRSERGEFNSDCQSCHGGPVTCFEGHPEAFGRCKHTPRRPQVEGLGLIPPDLTSARTNHDIRPRQRFCEPLCPRIRRGGGVDPAREEISALRASPGFLRVSTQLGSVEVGKGSIRDETAALRASTGLLRGLTRALSIRGPIAKKRGGQVSPAAPESRLLP